MKWMQFLTPVAGMDTEDARAYLRKHKEGTYTLLAGCSKTLRYKAPEIPRSETYMKVRRNDEG
jgi:hypothetical protein